MIQELRLPAKLFKIIASVIIVTLYSCNTIAKPPCQIIIDAGSNGSRLFVYRKLDNGWTPTTVKKTSALADSIREVNGKKWSDRSQTISNIIKLISTAPTSDCKLNSISVLATAGMRLAEAKHPNRSALFWSQLKKSIRQQAGEGVTITAHTLTGFEEGIYAWLATKEKEKNNQFGLIEMGGASLQIIFPCETCKNTMNVLIDNKLTPFFGTSFLGAGANEAYKLNQNNTACHQQAGVDNSNWKAGNCIKVTSNQRNSYTLIDKYNYRGKPKSQNQSVALPISKKPSLRWVLQDGFYYSQPSKIIKCCQTRSPCSRPKTSCFQPIYAQYILDILGIDYEQAVKQDLSWTLGAAICNSTNCLSHEKGNRKCLWMKDNQCAS